GRIAGLTDDLEAGVLEQACDSLAQEHRIVREHDARARAEAAHGCIGAERRKVAVAELVDPLGLVEPAQSVLAEVAERNGGVGERRDRRLRKQVLSPLARRAAAGRTEHY